MEIKKVFHKDMRFYLYPFRKWTSQKKKKKELGCISGCKVMRDVQDVCPTCSLTWRSADCGFFPLNFYLLDILPSDVAPPSWGKIQTECVRLHVRDCWPVSEKQKKSCTVCTRSDFKTQLNQVAEDGFFWTLGGLNVCSEPSQVKLCLSNDPFHEDSEMKKTIINNKTDKHKKYLFFWLIFYLTE